MSIFRKWYCRGLVAVLVGCAAEGIWTWALDSQFVKDSWFIPFFGMASAALGRPIAYSFLLALPPVLAAVLIYGLLTRMYAKSPVGSETRCRKCNYILRGITEPRCPECGERI